MEWNPLPAHPICMLPILVRYCVFNLHIYIFVQAFSSHLEH